MCVQPDPHVDNDDLERYSLGDSDEASAARIEEHLLVCNGCRGRLTQVDEYHRAMREAAAKLRNP
jgi:predicted anti-sigma-YlaC factor YlaD